MTSPDLVSRFDTVHALKTLEDQDQALQQMSYEELARQPILFGEAKKGQKYGEVVQKDPAYCRWFLKKWINSPKAEHRMFCHFLNMWIERKELSLGIETTPGEMVGPEPTSSHVCPKAQAKSVGKPFKPLMPIDLDLEEEECWDRLSQDHKTDKEDETAKRLDHLEGVLSEVIADVVPTSLREPGQQLATNSETFLIEQCIREYNQYLQNPGSERFSCHTAHVRKPHQSNKILQELVQYGVSHGWIPQKGDLIGSQTPGIDSLEIYCSSDSQLTKQCIRQGLRAMRFGLREGDLSHFEGRAQLYHVLFKFRPRNIWMSPKCKAWCRWNQFNASRSESLAQRVMHARMEDEPHLMLCEAVFTLQSQRGPEFHFHLEQPVGSDMLYQDFLQIIVANTHLARCDLCTAGNLKHPVSKMALQKGTQVLTTSQIMFQYLSSLRCPHDHEHSQVAGSFRDATGKSLNVSTYSEMYTQMFGQRLARTFAASKKVSETSCVHSPTVFAEEVEGTPVEPEAKRR